MYSREQCVGISYVTNPVLVALATYWVADAIWVRAYGNATAIYKWAVSMGIGHIDALRIETNAVPVLIAGIMTVMFTRSFWRSRIGQ